MEPGQPVDVDLERANVARIYDYWLGGAHHFAVDREQGDLIEASNPDARHSARSNRAFLGRVVRWCLQRGVDQFLDLGSGVPTVGNVHEVAAALNPDARVAYVDMEPVAVAHASEILRDVDTATITGATLCEAEAVLAAPGVAGLLDFGRPVAVLALAVAHFVHGDLAAIFAPYADVMARGSVLALSHVSDDQDDPELVGRIHAATEAYRGTASEVTLRSRTQLAEVLAGFDVVAPGIVDLTDWPTASPDAVPVGMYGVVGVKH